MLEKLKQFEIKSSMNIYGGNSTDDTNAGTDILVVSKYPSPSGTPLK